MADMHQTTLLLAFPAAMVFAAAMDMLTMTIPNRISLALIGIFAVAAAVGGLSLELVAAHLGAGALMLILGVGMFAMGWVGGGDAKLLASAALWLGPLQLLPFLLLTGMIGSCLLLIISLYRAYPAGAMPIPAWALRLHRSETGLPYGVAIGAAGLAVFPYSPLFQALI